MENIGVCVILQNAQGQILLGERVNSYKAGFYGMPGGRIEAAESLMDSCKREVKEETGLDIKNIKYVGVVREFQESYTFIHFGFLVQDISGVPFNTEPDKCRGWDWYSPESLPQNILPGHKALIQMYSLGETLVDLV